LLRSKRDVTKKMPAAAKASVDGSGTDVMVAAVRTRGVKWVIGSEDISVPPYQPVEVS
jgi:hypothetical protein